MSIPCEWENKNLIHQEKIRVLIENLKIRRICDSQTCPRGMSGPRSQNSLQEALEQSVDLKEITHL